jgi:hypothetical protein
MKRGTTRPDGYRFWSYRKMPEGRLYEVWMRPSTYLRSVESTRVAVRNNRARKAASLLTPEMGSLCRNTQS